MKKIVLLFFVLLKLNTLHATIYRLGFTGMPVSGIDFSYTDFGSAQNTASAGDTIQVYQQLSTSSAGYTVSKPLHIMGFGHSLDVNTGYQVQQVKDSSRNWVSITFAAGSAGGSVEGLNLSGVTIADSNITVRRCRFQEGFQMSWWNNCSTGSPFMMPRGYNGGINLYLSPTWAWWGARNLNNITIDACYFDSWQGIAVSVSLPWGSSDLNINNLVITNCYFNKPLQLSTSLSGQVNGVFMNNIVNHKFRHLYSIANWGGNNCTQGIFSNYNDGMISNFDGFLIKNNIFNTDDTVTCPLNAPNSIIQNNVFSTGGSYACVGLGGGNNIYGADMNAVFSSAWNNGYVYNDNQLALAPNSPAAAVGILGNNAPTDCGVYGGESGFGYVPSGIPPVPSVYLLTTPGVNASSNPYQITISVKSHQ